MRVLDILEILEDYPSGLTLAEISEKINLPKSSTHRILGVLLERQYVRESYGNGKYLLGYQILSLAKTCVNGIDLLNEARPFMEALNNEFNETVILGVPDHNYRRIIYLDKIDSSHSLRLVSNIGERVPIHCTALGKAILSKLEEDKVRKILENYELRKFTDNTILNLEEFIKELHKINKAGVAIDREEYKPFVSCVAAPIRNYDGMPIAAISMSIPTTRFTSERKQLIIDKLIDCAHSIDAILSLIKEKEMW